MAGVYAAMTTLLLCWDSGWSGGTPVGRSPARRSRAGLVKTWLTCEAAIVLQIRQSGEFRPMRYGTFCAANRRSSFSSMLPSRTWTSVICFCWASSLVSTCLRTMRRTLSDSTKELDSPSPCTWGTSPVAWSKRRTLRSPCLQAEQIGRPFLWG